MGDIQEKLQEKSLPVALLSLRGNGFVSNTLNSLRIASESGPGPKSG